VACAGAYEAVAHRLAERRGSLTLAHQPDRTNHCTRSKIGVYSLPLEEV